MLCTGASDMSTSSPWVVRQNAKMDVK